MSTELAYVFVPFRLLPGRRMLSQGDTPIKLGSRAFDMLQVLVEARDRTVGKDELLDRVWPGLVVEPNNLQVQVVALRKLLGHAAIATVPGRGYRFTLPVTLEGPPEAAGAAPPASARADDAPPRSNLPAWLPLLIGRDADRRQLAALLRQHALVTVAGPGGIGKTRLAQAVAIDAVAETPGGVWWVDLAPLSDASLLTDAVAQAMGLRLEGARDVGARLAASLREHEPLLVLDNAEHLVEAVAAFVTGLRRAVPRQRLLVTSQEALRLDDECVLRLEPLGLPADDTPTTLADNGAVTLFVARARAADRWFTPTDAQLPRVADICRRLDGIPLAIELAAARVPLLGLDGLYERLDQRLSVLTSGPRNAMRRHQTLRAALEWSYQLLTEPERRVLARLGVFVGGFTLDAAQAVAADDSIDPWDVLEHLGALVDKSLVVSEGGALPRYRLLETTRLYALERLAEQGPVGPVRGRHREHFVERAERARLRMLVADARGLAELDRERDNLLLALAWTQDDPGGSQGLRLAGALRYYWTSRGLLRHGLELMREVLQRPAVQGPSIEHCTLLGAAGQYAGWTGDGAAALRDTRLALDMARALGDAPTLCLALAGAGFVELQQGQTEAARTHAAEALAQAARLGDCRERGNALALQASLHRLDGQRQAARGVLHELVALHQRLNLAWSEAVDHLNLAQMAIDDDDAALALPHLRRVLALLPRVDSQHIGLHLLGTVAEWAALAGRHDASVLLDAASRRQCQRVGMDDDVEPSRLQRCERARQAVPPEHLEDVQQAGRAMSYAGAITQLRQLLDAPDQ